MKKLDWTNAWVGMIGLFITSIGSTSLLAFKLGAMDERIMVIEKEMPPIKNTITNMQTDISAIKVSMVEMQVKLDVLWRFHLSKTNSSMKLTDDELNTLKISGVDGLVNGHYPEILSKVRSLKPDNSNEVQELLISIVNTYKKDIKYSFTIQAASLSTGYDVDSLLLIAAMSIKDKAVSDLGLARM